MEKETETNLSKFHEAIRNAHQEKSFVYAWQLEGEVLLKVELLIESYKIDRAEIILQTTTGMEQLLVQMITGLGKLNFYIANSSLVFSSDIKKLEPSGKLIIGFPEFFQFHDRRELTRYEILGLPISVKFKYKDREFKKPCFDISKGGISLLFPQGEKVPYKDGDIIPDMRLEFGTHSLPFEAKVIRILKLRPYMIESIPYGGSRLSLKFGKMTDADKAILTKLNGQIEDLLKKKKGSD